MHKTPYNFALVSDALPPIIALGLVTLYVMIAYNQRFLCLLCVITSVYRCVSFRSGSSTTGRVGRRLPPYGAAPHASARLDGIPPVGGGYSAAAESWSPESWRRLRISQSTSYPDEVGFNVSLYALQSFPNFTFLMCCSWLSMKLFTTCRNVLDWSTAMMCIVCSSGSLEYHQVKRFS